MAEQHHHHHHRKDSATRFKERSLRAIEFRRKAERCLKYVLVGIAALMILAVLYAYFFG